MKILQFNNKINYRHNLNRNPYAKFKFKNSYTSDTFSFKGDKKQQKQLSIYDMVCSLKEAGMSEADIEYLYKRDDYRKLIKEAYELTIQGIKPSLSTEIVLFDTGFERAQECIDLNLDFDENIKELLHFDEKRYSKARRIFQLKGSLKSSIITSSLEDNEFEIAINLIKAGLDSNYAYKYAILNSKIQDRLFYLLRKGISSQEAVKICNLSDKNYDFVIRLIDKGASASDAYFCATIPLLTHTFDALTKYNPDDLEYDDVSASVIANIMGEPNKEQRRAISKITNTIKANCSSCETLSYDLNDIIFNYEGADILKELAEYIEQIDFDSLRKIAPQMKDYTSFQLLAFINWHFKNKTQTFDEKTLTFKENLASYFEENLVKSPELDKILYAHPLTKKEVGNIPNDWLDKTKDKTKTTQIIYKAIAEFQKTLNKETLAQTLSQTLNKSVNVRKVGQGCWGAVYKISIEGAKDTCLKIFLDNHTDITRRNGASVEVQAAIFANKNSNDFVKMYFGKVCDSNSNDGFLVTQYLDKNTIPETTGTSDSVYKISTDDNNNGDNIINGKIVDFGWITVDKR